MSDTTLRKMGDSVPIREAAEQHAPDHWLGRYRWPSRYWQGAWLTVQGWAVHSWVDEIHEAEVLAARGHSVRTITHHEPTTGKAQPSLAAQVVEAQA